MCFCIWMTTLAVVAQESWQDALTRMPLNPAVRELDRSNCVEVMLRSFGSNETVRALVFMPGATDEFYMFRRARATITNNSPTLLDALEALTNQTRIRASFRAPLLLLHTDEDPLEPIGEIQDPGTEVKLEWTQFMAHAIYDDRDWDYLVPILSKKLKVRFSPARHSRNSWHFYRHSLAEWNLNGREALEAIALAGKTRFIVGHNNVNFSGDERYLERPKLDSDAVFGDRPVSK